MTRYAAATYFSSVSLQCLPQLPQPQVDALARKLDVVERRAERSIAAHETQNVKNCEPAMFGPWRRTRPDG